MIFGNVMMVITPRLNSNPRCFPRKNQANRIVVAEVRQNAWTRRKWSKATESLVEKRERRGERSTLWEMRWLWAL